MTAFHSANARVPEHAVMGSPQQMAPDPEEILHNPPTLVDG